MDQKDVVSAYLCSDMLYDSADDGPDSPSWSVECHDGWQEGAGFEVTHAATGRRFRVVVTEIEE